MTPQEEEELYSIFAAERLAAGYSEDQVFDQWEAELKKERNAEELTGHAEGKMSKAFGVASELARHSPASYAAKGVESVLGKLGINLPIAETAQDYQSGIVGGLGNALMGARETWNSFTDPEELRQLNMDSELRNAALQELTGNSPIASELGGAVGQILPVALGGAGLGTTALRYGPQALQQALATKKAMAAMGLVSGATEGGMQSYGREQEEEGARGEGIETGAKWGLAGGLAGPVIQGAKNTYQNVKQFKLGQENLEDLVAKALRTTRGDATQPMMQNIRDQHTQYVAKKQDELKDIYDLAESMSSPAGTLSFSPDDIFNPEVLRGNKNVVESLLASPAYLKLMEAKSAAAQLPNGLSSASSQVPPLPQADFKTLSQAQREISAQAAALEGVDHMNSTKTSLQEIANRLQSQIDSHAAAIPSLTPANSLEKLADKKWAEEIAPYTDTGKDYSGRIGNWNAGGKEWEGYLQNIDKNPDAWASMGIIAPDALEDMRKIYAHQNLLNSTEKVHNLRDAKMQGLVFDDPEAQRFALQTADQLDAADTVVGKFLENWTKSKVPLGKSVQTLAQGRLPYGVAKKQMTDAERIASALRGSIVGASMLPLTQPQERR